MGESLLGEVALEESSLEYKVDECEYGGHEVSQIERGNGNKNASPSSDWVGCPVCSGKVCGDDYAINSHLGSPNRV